MSDISSERFRDPTHVDQFKPLEVLHVEEYPGSGTIFVSSNPISERPHQEMGVQPRGETAQ